MVFFVIFDIIVRRSSRESNLRENVICQQTRYLRVLANLKEWFYGFVSWSPQDVDSLSHLSAGTYLSMSLQVWRYFFLCRYSCKTGGRQDPA